MPTLSVAPRRRSRLRNARILVVRQDPIPGGAPRLGIPTASKLALCRGGPQTTAESLAALSIACRGFHVAIVIIGSGQSLLS